MNTDVGVSRAGVDDQPVTEAFSDPQPPTARGVVVSGAQLWDRARAVLVLDDEHQGVGRLGDAQDAVTAAMHDAVDGDLVDSEHRVVNTVGDAFTGDRAHDLPDATQVIGTELDTPKLPGGRDG